MADKIIMNSGRVYNINEYEDVGYTNGWIHFRDQYDDPIIEFRQDLVEAKVFQEDGWVREPVNSNKIQ